MKPWSTKRTQGFIKNQRVDPARKVWTPISRKAFGILPSFHWPNLIINNFNGNFLLDLVRGNLERWALKIDNVNLAQNVDRFLLETEYELICIIFSSRKS